AVGVGRARAAPRVAPDRGFPPAGNIQACVAPPACFPEVRPHSITFLHSQPEPVHAAQVGLVTASALQERLDLVALEGGVACFGSRSPTHAVALLDVVGAEAA